MKEKLLHRKRAAFAVLFILLLSVAGVTNATAQSFTVGDLTYSFNDDGASVTLTGHVDGISGQLVIPESVELYGTSYSVTRIGDDAFQYCYDLTGDLVIPNSVITIGQDAFWYCHNMTGSLIIGNSVQNIRPFAFVGCNFTGTLTIPESVTEICWNVFDGCDFTTLNFNASNCYLYGGWLNGTSFTTLNLGANLTSIPDGLTSGCTTFTGSLIIPSSVSRIGDGAFNGCSGFTGTLVIPETVTYIGSSAFNGCSGFTGSLTISNAVTSIGNEAFNGCSGFTGSLTIPNTVTNIGNSAFMNCSGFSGTLTLGQSLTEIGNSAFFGACENFTSFNVLAETPPTLGNYVFLSVNTEIPVYVTCGALEAYQNASGWSSFTNLQETNPCMWEITVSTNPAEGGTVNGVGVYEQGQTCILTATPNEDYIFVNWTEDGEEVSTESSYSFTVTGNRNLVANFRNIRYNVWVTVKPAEGGTVSASESGRSLDLYYDFEDGMQGWTAIDGGSPQGYGWQLASYADANLVGSGHNESSNFMLSKSYDNGYGVIYPDNYLVSPQVALGGSITFYACAQDPSYAAEHFGVAVSTGSNTNPSDFQMVQEWTMTAKGIGASTEVTRSGNRWQGNWYQYTVDMSAYSGMGYVAIRHFNCYDQYFLDVDDITISNRVGDPIGSYLEGETCTLTATPNEGWEFYNWLENGTVVSTDAEYSFTVNSNRSLVARFRNLNAITFADPIVEARCVELWDTDGDGYLSYDEAAAVTSLNYAFQEWGNITSFDELQYFTGLTYINDWEMAGCRNLTSIVLPESLTSINYAAFEYSYSLQSIVIPESVTYIGGWAFSYCYALTSIIMQADTPPSISDDCPFCSTDMGNVVVTVPCGATSSYQNAYIWGDFGNYQEPDDCIYEITATVNHEEAGSVSGTGSYQKGTTCTLTATANEGYTFVCWTKNGTMISNASTYSFTVTGNAIIVANFSENQQSCGTLGYTTYDWQSNTAAITRTIVWPDGKINFAFTQANETSFSDRGTGIGTYDAVNDEWIPIESRVENERTGFGSIARYGQNGIVVAAHTNTRCGVYIIEDKDNITPNSTPAVSYLDPTYELEWPNVMTSGPNRDIIHMVATVNGYTSIPGMENVYQPILYFRSQDGGLTWDRQNVILPFMDANYCLNWGSNVCYWMETTEDNCLALVVNNAWSDGMVIYSYDNGETWERKVFYKHPNPFGYFDDMFLYPRYTSCQWDSQHQLHVLYEFNGCTGEVGSGSYYPGIGGIAYWNETMPYNTNGTTQSSIEGNLIPNQPFVMDKDYLYNDIYSSSWWLQLDGYGVSHEMWPEYVGYLPALDDNGNCEDPYQATSFNIYDRSLHGMYNSGICSFPVLCMVPGTNDMVAIWCAMDENHTDDYGMFYYKIFASYSVDGGLYWTNMVHLTNMYDNIFDNSEFAYLQAAVVDNQLVIASQMDGQTGIYVHNNESNPYDNLYIGLTFDLEDVFGVVPGNTFYISATANLALSGTVNGSGIYDLGQTCTLSAIPNEEFEFVSWTENGVVVSTDETYSFTVTGHRDLVANFHMINSNPIIFADSNVEAICVANWDIDGDGALCYSEAAIVTDLGWTFSYNSNITSFNELQYFTGLTSIGYSAFYECTSLTSIVIPEGVTLIDSYAFYDCYNLVSVNIPDGVVWIGEYAFYVSGLLGELTLPEPLEYVGEYAFFGCDGITTVNYNAVNCQTMGSAAKPVFYDCAFTHLNIGANVQNIPNFAFKRCFMITDMTVAAVNPPTIYPGTFGMVSRSIPVSVPHGSGDIYRNTLYWEEFFNINEVYFNDVQITQLSEGWNWFSTYVGADDLLDQLEAGLGTNGVSINTQGAVLVYRNGRWIGGLHSIENNKGYKIKTSAPIEVTIEGQIVDPSSCPITITQGSNWMGYPLSESKTVGTALAGFTPSNGDVIMTQGGTTVYRNGHWLPATFTFKPGKGYIYKSTSLETKTLIFSNGEK